MNTFTIWWLKTVCRNRVIMVVLNDGSMVNYLVRKVKTTEDNKSYVETEDKKVGFLDNPSQKSGEFRKGLSDPNLVRWFEI